MGALLYFSRFLAGFLDIDLIAYIYLGTGRKGPPRPGLALRSGRPWRPNEPGSRASGRSRIAEFGGANQPATFRWVAGLAARPVIGPFSGVWST